jgi:hypothetical protein
MTVTEECPKPEKAFPGYRERQRLDAQVGEPGEVGGEGGVLQHRGVDDGDAFSVVHQVKSVVAGMLEAEAQRALGEGERSGGEVGQIGSIRVVEVEAGSALSEPVDGPDGRAVAPEARDAPRARQHAFGRDRFGVALTESGEQLGAEGVLVKGAG